METPQPHQVSEWVWELPATDGMRVPGRIYADRQLMGGLYHDQSLTQVANVACLPGILSYSLAMPDIHFGYGFPIGGVAAFSADEGVVSPGGVGYDINCGCRLLATDLEAAEVQDRIPGWSISCFATSPRGSARAVRSPNCPARSWSDCWSKERHGLWSAVTAASPIWSTQKMGAPFLGLIPTAVSERAYTRGQDQVGTLGSGNHFLEIQVVDEIFDREAASAFGLHEGQVTVMVHCGSRGLGYQVCDDYLVVMAAASGRYHIDLPDRQLACAPVASPRAGSTSRPWLARPTTLGPTAR